jgi:formylglycine-generating enzyme required for sulfatase activity
MSLVMAGCKSSPPSYFRKVTIKGGWEIIGTFPISEKLARTVNCYHFTYNKDNKPIRIEYYENGILVPDDLFGVERVVIEYNNKNEKRVFQNRKGLLKKNKQGVYSTVIEFAKQGHPISLTNCNVVGEPMLDKNEVAKYIWTTNDNGFVISTIFADKVSKIIDKDGPNEVRYEYDKYGYLAKESYFNKDGTRFGYKDNIAIEEYINDEFGNILETKFYDINYETAIFNKEAYVLTRFKYDSFGYLIEKTKYNNEDKLLQKQQYQIDSYGNIVEERFRVKDGHSKENYEAKMTRWIFDRKNNTITKIYYGIDGKITIIKPESPWQQGYSIIKTCYDKDGNEIEVMHLDSTFTLVSGFIDGIAIHKNAYDSVGNRIEERYYGVDYLPKNNIFGVSIFKNKYDKYGNHIEMKYFDKDGKLGGIIKTDYNNDGNIVMEAFYDQHGNLSNSPSGGYAIKKFDFDESGKLIRTTYIDQNNKVVKVDQKPIIEWVYIPAGTFSMGSPTNEVGRGADETQHQVTLNSYKISKYEITTAQFKAFVDATGYVTDAEKGTGAKGSVIWTGKKHEVKADANWKCDVNGKPRPVEEYSHPVIHVSWNDADAFAKWIGCRLPTEAEWEYACRAGTTTPFNTGNNLTTAQANYDGNYPYNNNPKGEYRGQTMPVGSFSPNGFGLYDMHGNVSEWCSDWQGDYTNLAQNNPKGSESGSCRIYRGGSWCDLALGCRSASRNSNFAAARSNFTGFRLVSP